MSTFDEVLFKRSLSPAARTDGTASGVAVDRMANGGMQDAIVVVSTGTVTDGSHAVAIQDSADGSTDWQAVAAAQLTSAAPTLVAASDDTVFEVGVRASRRFLRVVVVSTGSTTGGIFSAAVALGRPRFAPVSRA
ncbi:hypothetical protein [Streptomyces europaeiscabiei]|uniref:hypothetical protein n=1 Tax=Streptomyces europaeiscabiei TaxID=146819 RepID=UPI0029A0DAC7|nr:hypothetical protein [Streptomyces europaeiscabiei]MDX3777740.1 hypothetical protein [Streptomyces europaeiscabiei]